MKTMLGLASIIAGIFVATLLGKTTKDSETLSFPSWNDPEYAGMVHHHRLRLEARNGCLMSNEKKLSCPIDRHYAPFLTELK